MSDWQAIETAPLGVAVETKIDDGQGERNIQTLVQRRRAPEFEPLWWAPDGSMYVYYRPTHWRECSGAPA